MRLFDDGGDKWAVTILDNTTRGVSIINCMAITSTEELEQKEVLFCTGNCTKH
jgi:hypothetical protein